MLPRVGACLLILSSITAAALLASALFGPTYIGVDDANIAMVYARNLATGNGFVYNVDGERVEGFTSLLYVIIMAIAFSVSPFPELVLHGFVVLLVGFSVSVLFGSLRALTADGTRPESWIRPCLLVMIAWVIASPAFIVWTTISLMDTSLWCFMFASSVAIVLSEIADHAPSRLRLSIMASLAGLMPIARPEGFALVPIVILTYALGRRMHTSKWRDVLPCLFVPALVWLVVLTCITTFRVVYFGFPLPNTYYAKVSPDTLANVAAGMQYLAKFVRQHSLVMLVLGAITAGLVLNAKLAATIVVHGRIGADRSGKRSRLRLAHFVVSLISTVGLVLPLYGGGDHFEGFRFYQPLWPILILPLILLGHDVVAELTTITWDRHRLSWTVSVASVPLLFGLVGMPWPTQPRDELLDEFLIAQGGRRLGSALNRLFPEGHPRVGVTAAGGVQYTYRGPVFDLLGLNHVAMGHSPGRRLGYKNHAAFDKDVFWSVQPSLVLPILCPGPIDTTVAGNEFNKGDGIVLGLFRDVRFQSRYVLAAVYGTAERPIFEDDPFFFAPRWLRPPRASAYYRDATLITYLQPDVVDRLRGYGWTVVLLNAPRPESDTREHLGIANPCTPPPRGR